MRADVHLELGNLADAWSMARAAKDAAEKAGNELDLASAVLVLGRLHHASGRFDDARVLLTDAKARFFRLGHEARAAEINRLMRRAPLARAARAGQDRQNRQDKPIAAGTAPD